MPISDEKKEQYKNVMLEYCSGINEINGSLPVMNFTASLSSDEHENVCFELQTFFLFPIEKELVKKIREKLKSAFNEVSEEFADAMIKVDKRIMEEMKKVENMETSTETIQ